MTAGYAQQFVFTQPISAILFCASVGFPTQWFAIRSDQGVIGRSVELFTYFGQTILKRFDKRSVRGVGLFNR